MLITCPHCGYCKEINQAQMPENADRVNCPKCKLSFPLQPQPPEIEAQPERAGNEHQCNTHRPQTNTHAEIDALPKAGFWMRLVATIIDAFIVFVLQFLLGSLLALAGIAAAGQQSSAGSIAVLVQLFGFALSVAYYVIFTGYCGQTPGKMALRIKVIRRDGSSLSYGRAAFREIPAKFISGIIFGIGYLMVAFDEQKQGLHDRMADTYVIKL